SQRLNQIKDTKTLIHWGPTVHLTCPTCNTWGFWLSMRSKKQTEWQQLLMESSLACRRGMEVSRRKQKA
ncbi:hypothetical protein AVEN_180878-1, partial [Araneus ventricosus]